VDLRGLRTPIVDTDLHQNIFRRLLGVFHKDVEISVLVENAGVDQLILEFLAAAPLVAFD
jgi:hypothetical protein